MIAGWRQWADAGSISSALPQYLVRITDARHIGSIKPENYYLFQIPGTHHFLRPIIKLNDGFRKDLEVKRNDIYFANIGEKGLVIFLGDEPHLNVEAYTSAFFDVVQALNVKRVAIVGGVYGSMPYDKEREVGCIYSQPYMRAELDGYALRFSNYEGGSTIGSYIVARAQEQTAEYLAMYAFVPAYEFSESDDMPQGIRIENDFKAWHELMRRINHMFQVDINLKELAEQSEELVATLDEKVEELERELPQFGIRDYFAELDAAFVERPFLPLGDVWEQELRHLFDDSEE